jgi:hypothetical protein
VFGAEVDKMAKPTETFLRKVRTIFDELAGERAPKLGMNGALSVIAAALADDFGPERAADIGFHLSDWGEDAAFLVALHLFPERFTVEEIRDGVTALLIHAPNHIAAAAHLAGWPLHDVFRVGLKLDD